MDVLIDKYIIGLYQSLEDEVIADIARRVKKTGRYTETAELMAKSMVEQGYSAEKIQAEVMKMLRADKQLQMEIAENTKAYKQDIQNIINKTVKEAKKAGNTAVAEAGNMAWNNDLSMWSEHGANLEQPNTMSQMIEAFQKQTNRELRNLTRTTGFKNTVFGTTGVINAYQREMDIALLKVSTGTFSYDQAVNDCVHRLAQSGLRSIDYANGRTYQLDTAVRMSVRTGMSQLAGKIMEENLKNSGQDLVITSQHMGSRPEHAPWQNKVFSYSGKSKKYPDFFKETGYGTAAGLKGVNCTHDFYPFWEGSSIIPDDIVETAPVTVNGKEYNYYQATQQQRKMERGIRATKREIEAQRTIGGDTTDLQAQLRRQTADYHRFSRDVGIRAKDNRLRVVSGSSDLNRTNVAKGKKNDIMKIDLQFFAEDLRNQSSQSLSKGIKTLNKRIKEHEDKVANPQAYMKNWYNACEQEKLGTVDAWKREIERYKKQVNARIDELKERGDYNE
ncbi:MAG: phage minor capsid protein [Lachnospiraceae bacterium]|nr:phage minor capsid protein [Lachnospiraceae bacterium]